MKTLSEQLARKTHEALLYRQLDRQRVECFRRNDEGLWVLQFYTPQQTSFRLDSIGFEGTLDALYEDVVFE